MYELTRFTSDDESSGRDLRTRVSRIFLLCRTEISGLSEKMENVWQFGRVPSQDIKILPKDISYFKIKRVIS
jgi:hypothetical protein